MGKPTVEDLREAFRAATSKARGAPEKKARRKPPKWRTIKCKRCGTEVSTMARQTKYCPDCAYIVKREQSLEAYERRKTTQMKTQGNKTEKKRASQLAALVDAARKAGLSYGRYVAMMEMQKGA